MSTSASRGGVTAGMDITTHRVDRTSRRRHRTDCSGLASNLDQSSHQEHCVFVAHSLAILLAHGRAQKESTDKQHRRPAANGDKKIIRPDAKEACREQQLQQGGRRRTRVRANGEKDRTGRFCTFRCVCVFDRPTVPSWRQSTFLSANVLDVSAGGMQEEEDGTDQHKLRYLMV